MNTDLLLVLAREIIGGVPFCVAMTEAEEGGVHGRVVQPMPLQDDWTVNVLTNRRCRKVREIERSGRLTLLYQNDRRASYVCLAGRAEIVEDLDLKRSTWTSAHDRWNTGGPNNPATVFMRLTTERIELWSAADGVMPEPRGYSAVVLHREGQDWRCEAT